MNKSYEQLLDLLGMHSKWHLPQSGRTKCIYSINEAIIELICKRINIENGFFC